MSIDRATAAVSLAGLLLSLALFGVLRRFEVERAKGDFRTSVTQVAAALDRQIGESEDVLRNLAVIYERSGRMRRADFERAADTELTRHPGLMGAAWIPIVPAADRAQLERGARREGLEGFQIRGPNDRPLPPGQTSRPALYLYPPHDLGAHGRDLSHQPRFTEAARNATDTGVPLAYEDELGHWMVGPVFEPHGATFVVSGRRRAEAGHLRVRLSPERMLQVSLRGRDMMSSSFSLLAGGGQALASIHSAEGEAWFETPLALRGPRWILSAKPSPAFITSHRGALPYVGAFTGMALLALLLRHLRQRTRYTERIEAQVAERTQELTRRSREMRRVLDHVDRGLITIDHHGQMASTTSRVLDTWFGPVDGETDIANYLARVDPVAAELLGLALTTFDEGFMPPRICLLQLPKRLVNEALVLDATYIPFEDDDGPRILLVLADVSVRLHAQRKERVQQEIIRICEHIGRDQKGMAMLYRSGSELIERLEATKDIAEAKRLLHTLKGNCSAYGLSYSAELCHEVETAVEEHQSLASVQRVRGHWAELVLAFERFLRTDEPPGIEVSADEHATLLEKVTSRFSHEVIRAELERWRFEPVEARLDRLRTQATNLARAVGKGELRVHVDHGSVRLPRGRFEPLWDVITHVVRNAVDHGLEPASDEKTPELILAAEESQHAFIIEVRDNGRGIDWGRLEARRQQLGLEKPHRREDLLFLDGLSSRPEVNAVSGRGVGMSAVAAVVRELGGSIDVETSQAGGTAFRFRFPS